MTAPAPTDDRRAEARERFYQAAYEWCADPACATALAELEDAYEALSELLRADLADKLGRAA